MIKIKEISLKHKRVLKLNIQVFLDSLVIRKQNFIKFIKILKIKSLYYPGDDMAKKKKTCFNSMFKKYFKVKF